MFELIVKTLVDKHLMPLIMAGIAALALGMALISENVFGLEPCILCVIQRWPYGIVIGLGVLGFLLSFKYKKPVSMTLGLIGITFFANSIIAFYHSGVELHWWKSFLEGCSVPGMAGDMAQILADIQSRTKAVRCDEIPWADPIFNLSMANYNVVFCLGLAVISFTAANMICKSRCA